MYEAPPNSGNINITKLKSDLESLNSVSMTNERANTILTSIFDFIKLQLARKEINLQNILISNDDGDGLLDKNEIRLSLSKLGFAEVKEEMIQAIFLIFDHQSKGSFLMKDFLTKLYEHINQKKIVDQTYCISVIDNKTNKLDYDKFADFVGYELPKESSHVNKDVERNFYRRLLKNYQSQQSSFLNTGILDRLQNSLSSQDTELRQVIHISFFSNAIMRLCEDLMKDQGIIELIAIGFTKGTNEFVYYEDFMQRVRFEFQKLTFLRNVYKTLYETLEFKALTDLYTLFQPYDTRKDKQFDKEQIRQCLAKRGITVGDTELTFIFHEYSENQSQQKELVSGYIKYSEIEKDYREFSIQIRSSAGMKREANLPDILRTIKRYLDNNVQSLRQVFNKNKVGDSDMIDQFTFSKIIDKMAKETGNVIDEGSIHKFKLELITNSQNAVSFSEMLKIYNQFFNIEDDDEKQFIPFYIEKLLQHIALTAIDKKAYGFQIEQNFMYPSSTYSQFMNDLKKEPLFCLRESTQ